MPQRVPKTQKRASAFTLVEILVVILLMSILMALMVPAVNGLIGISGPRGGVNTLSAAIDNAKLAAMEHGTFAYLAFPTSSTNAENALSQMILFRSQKPGEEAPFVPLSRWIALPDGVYVESDDLSTFTVEEGNLPPLEGENITSLRGIGFDCLGRLAGTSSQARIRIGGKETPDGNFSGKSESHFVLAVEPLTGRASVSSVSKTVP